MASPLLATIETDDLSSVRRWRTHPNISGRTKKNEALTFTDSPRPHENHGGSIQMFKCFNDADYDVAVAQSGDDSIAFGRCLIKIIDRCCTELDKELDALFFPFSD